MLRSFRLGHLLLAATATMLLGSLWGAGAASASAPVLVEVVKLKLSSTGATVQLKCPTTSAQNCAGTIVASSTEVEGGKRVIGVQGPGPGETGQPTVVNIAESNFTLTPGQESTIPVKLNAVGVELLKRFHELPAVIDATEVVPALPSGKILFLFHDARFSQPPKKHKHKKHKSHAKH